MSDESADAIARRASRQQNFDWYVETDARGKILQKVCQATVPVWNVMRTHSGAQDIDANLHCFNIKTRTFEQCPHKMEVSFHRAILARLQDPNKAALYARKEEEAAAIVAGDVSIDALVLKPEADARGLKVLQLARLVLQRAQQDREAQARAWGWQESERVKASKV
jgi:hypothetical protein